MGLRLYLSLVSLSTHLTATKPRSCCLSPCHAMIFFSQFWLFNKSFFRNDQAKTLFLVLALFSHTNCCGVILNWVMSVQLVRLSATLEPQHVQVAGLAPRRIESCPIHWRDGALVTPIHMVWLKALLSSFLLIFSPPPTIHGVVLWFFTILHSCRRYWLDFFFNSSWDGAWVG
jgi:hypothetical protein